jgi:DNA-binding transcriptional LysR family regulator
LALAIYPEPIGLPPFVLRMVWHEQRSNDPAQIWLRSLIQREICPDRKAAGA